MGNHIDHLALRLWLSLVRLGGYYTVRELLKNGFEREDALEVRERLIRLSGLGMVRVKDSSGTLPYYGVTTLCQAPPGYEAHLKGPVPGDAP